MGVAESGKSSVASALAEALNCPMIEGDVFHTAQNRARMRSGIALPALCEVACEWLRDSRGQSA